ncbi:hypothetical protein M0R45_030588 [Rubus argutus]|uniref:Uncharacterized protein n=1 Tax=Rubus argutus TaxID=59490 RepID=A0AAW1WER5_RUBAR
MEILSWNCRGICNDSTVQALKTLIQQERPSLIFLCVTMVRDKDYMNKLRFQIGYMNCEAVLSVGQSGGLALFWCDGLDVRFCSKSHHHVDVAIHASDGSSLCLCLTSFYGHPSTAEREGQMQLFRDVLSYNDPFDLGFVGPRFTWQSSGVKSRLDRTVVSSSWSDVFTHARMLHLSLIHGDHVPLILGVFLSPFIPRRRSFRFRLESFWVVKKISVTRLSLLHWQCNTFGSRGKEIKLLHSRLQELLCLASLDVHQQEYHMLSSKLDSLLVVDHAYRSQRAKFSWLTDGDRNTKFFHRKASNRRAKNRLVGLFDDNGDWQSTNSGMEKVVLGYFSTIFITASLDEVHMNSVVDLIQPKVDAAMNHELCELANLQLSWSGHVPPMIRSLAPSFLCIP